MHFKNNKQKSMIASFMVDGRERHLAELEKDTGISTIRFISLKQYFINYLNLIKIKCSTYYNLYIISLSDS